MDRRSETAEGTLAAMNQRAISVATRHSRSIRFGRTNKKITVVAVVLMLLALVGYVLTNDESVEPGGGGEPMPALGE
ncbi:MAG: hypothetical protein RLZZ461_1427 [Planctomycetota bacterium]